MSIAERASAWWAAGKWLVLLCLLLCGSLALNAWQWKRAIEAPWRMAAADKDRALDTSEKLQADARASMEKLIAVADRTADRLAVAGRTYDRAAAQRPLVDAGCAPGAARMRAVNQAAGAGD